MLRNQRCFEIFPKIEWDYSCFDAYKGMHVLRSHFKSAFYTPIQYFDNILTKTKC